MDTLTTLVGLGLSPGAPLTLAAGDDELKVIALACVLLFVATLAAMRTVRRVSETRERERTRREIAAYVAEGSISPPDAARLLATGLNEQVASELAKGMSWGMVSAKQAQGMVQAMHQSAMHPGVGPTAPQG